MKERPTTNMSKKKGKRATKTYCALYVHFEMCNLHFATDYDVWKGNPPVWVSGWARQQCTLKICILT